MNVDYPTPYEVKSLDDLEVLLNDEARSIDGVVGKTKTGALIILATPFTEEEKVQRRYIRDNLDNVRSEFVDSS